MSDRFCTNQEIERILGMEIAPESSLFREPVYLKTGESKLLRFPRTLFENENSFCSDYYKWSCNNRINRQQISRRNTTINNQNFTVLCGRCVGAPGLRKSVIAGPNDVYVKYFCTEEYDQLWAHKARIRLKKNETTDLRGMLLVMTPKQVIKCCEDAGKNIAIKNVYNLKKNAKSLTVPRNPVGISQEVRKRYQAVVNLETIVKNCISRKNGD